VKGVICLVGTTSKDAVKVRGRLFPATIRECRFQLKAATFSDLMPATVPI
jgi:hypothetical protein